MNYKPAKNKSNKVEEPAVAYSPALTDDGNVFHLINLVNKGLTYNFFEKIVAKYNFTLQNWADILHISGKTLSRYQKENKNFDALQSEKIIQVDMLHAKGEAVFGNKENFAIWLHTKNVALGNIVPKTLLSNSFGIQYLMDELTRIEHGVLA